MSPGTRTAVALLATMLAGCLQTQDDSAYLPVSLQAPYSDLPEAPTGTPIESGLPVRLDSRQQEAVVAAVSKWMKDPGSASFGAMSAVKLRQGRIVVCGEVDGRNSAGAYAGMGRFIGVMMGKPMAPEFVVVSIARNAKPRAEIDAICQSSGIL